MYAPLGASDDKDKISCEILPHFFPIPHAVMSHWCLEINHGGSIYTMEMGKHYISGCCPPLSLPPTSCQSGFPAAPHLITMFPEGEAPWLPLGHKVNPKL